MKRVITGFLVIPPLISILTGCSGLAPAPQPVFTPIRPDATSTPTPLSTTSNLPFSTPTSVVPDQVAINNYTHSTNRFMISYPENWQFFERPDGVVFVDPGNQAGYSVVFNDAGEAYSEEELNQYLVTFVAQNFANKDSDFAAISQEQQADGSIMAQFASVDPNLGPAINEVRVWQRETIIFLILISATKEQWQLSRQKLQHLADTFTPLDTSPIAAVTPTPKLPVWELIGPGGNEFGFLYPSDWQVLHQEERLVTVAWPAGDMIFEASVFDWPGAENDPTGAAKEAALAYLEAIKKEQQHVRNQPPGEFPLDTVNGATIDFLYTSPSGTEMASSVITAASQGKMYRVVFTSPAAIYQGALQWFNPMYQSFKILSPEDSILKEGG